MQAISIGHAGILIRTRGITIVCDPWFVPAFFSSWCVFPRNDQLPEDVVHDICNPDFLYISHLHGQISPHVNLNASTTNLVSVNSFAPSKVLNKKLLQVSLLQFIQSRQLQMALRATLHWSCPTVMRD